MLQTETNTPEMRERVINAAGESLGLAAGTFDAAFEHGQWWVNCVCCSRSWSVADAEADTVAREKQLGIVDGFIFEEV